MGTPPKGERWARETEAPCRGGVGRGPQSVQERRAELRLPLTQQRAPGPDPGGSRFLRGGAQVIGGSRS